MKKVIDLIEERIKYNPRKICIFNESIALSYKKLWENVLSCSHELMELGIREKMTVAINVSGHQIDIIVLLLSLMKLRAKVLFIDDKYLSDYQRNYIIRMIDCNAIVSIVSNKISVKLLSEVNITLNPDDDTILYITTSGSTGSPKIIPKSNVDIVTSIINIQYNSNIKFGVKGMLLCSLHFAFSYIELFSQLLLGNEILCLSDVEIIDILRIHKLIEKYGINTIFLPTVIFKLISRNDAFLNYFPKSLKQIIVGGERLVIPDRFRDVAILNDVCVFNYYGCAEYSTIAIHKCDLSNDDLNNIPVGTISMFISAYLDCDNGKEGCLFVRNTYDNIEYCTHDVCCYGKDGELIVLDRDDNQIKVNSCKINLTDVEHYILRIEEIAECSVIAINSDDNQCNMCAFLRVNNRNIDSSTLRKLISKELPMYMRPTLIKSISSIPKLPSGKPDRIALRKLAEDMLENCIDIKEIIFSFIDEKEMGKSDFTLEEVGIDSMSFVYMISELEKKYGTTIGFDKMMDFKRLDVNQLVIELVDYIQSKGGHIE